MIEQAEAFRRQRRRAIGVANVMADHGPLVGRRRAEARHRTGRQSVADQRVDIAAARRRRHRSRHDILSVVVPGLGGPVIASFGYMPPIQGVNIAPAEVGRAVAGR